MRKQEVTKKYFTVNREAVPVVSYSIGDIFVDEGNDAFMLVTPSPNSVCLIQIYGGNRWTDAKVVTSTSELTEEEFKSISSGLTLTKVKRADFNFSL